MFYLQRKEDRAKKGTLEHTTTEAHVRVRCRPEERNFDCLMGFEPIMASFTGMKHRVNGELRKERLWGAAREKCCPTGGIPSWGKNSVVSPASVLVVIKYRYWELSVWDNTGN